MGFRLDSKFLTGVSWQDRQHRDVMRNITDLFVAIENGDGSEEMLKLLAFLDEYVVVHFHEEEKYARPYGIYNSAFPVQGRA